MYYRGFFGFKGQKPSGFNLKGQRADLFLGHRMSNRIQRKVDFLTLGKGQKKKPFALHPSLIPSKGFSCYSNWTLFLSGPPGDRQFWAPGARLLIEGMTYEECLTHAVSWIKFPSPRQGFGLVWLKLGAHPLSKQLHLQKFCQKPEGLVIHG